MEKENKVLSEKIKALESEAAQKQSEEVLKKDFDELNNRLSEELKKIDAFTKDNTDLLAKIKFLAFQNEEYKKEIAKVAAEISELKPEINTEEMISKKEYNELKEKFDQAEEFLRIVHGGTK